MLSVKHAAAGQLFAHDPRDVLAVRKLACHSALVRGHDPGCVLQLLAHRVIFFKCVHSAEQRAAVRTAALEVRDQGGELLHQSLRVRRGGPVDGQLVALRLDGLRQYHLLASFVEDDSLRRACPLKHARLQPGGGEDVDQE